MTSTGSASYSAWKTTPCSWTSARINGGSRSRAPSSPSCNIPRPGARAQAAGHQDAALPGAAGSPQVLRRHSRCVQFCRAGRSLHAIDAARRSPPRERSGPAGPLPPGSWQPMRTGQPIRPNGLERVDLLGLRALGPPAGRVLNPLVLLKAAVAVSLDGGVVNEDVSGAVVGGDEPVPLVGVEPFHSALSHVPSPGGTIPRDARARGPGWCGAPAKGQAWIAHGTRCQISQALWHVHELRLQPRPLNTIAQPRWPGRRRVQLGRGWPRGLPY